MSANTYVNLPLDALYNLLIISVKDMIDASESKKEDAIMAFRASKKQVELLMLTIEERKAMLTSEDGQMQNGA